jgi:peptide/nickel transport system substrate-binding protein
MRRAFQRQIRLGGRLRARVLAASGGAVALALVASGCGTAGAGTSGDTPVSGGVVTWALPANVVPNYIFPFTPGQYFSQVNEANLQYLLYRPLYMYGTHGLPYLNKSLSLAYPPVYNGQVVTIKLKPYQWSDGEPVNAGDVLFWMHMMQADAATEWGGYISGGIPDNVASVREISPTEVQMVIKGTYSQTWFTDNELSQITPMPSRAWDYTAAGPSDCTNDVNDCTAVFNYLNSQAADPANWAGSKFWRVVDGPWRLTGRTAQGLLTFRINPHYSGPLPAHHISEFQEVPFTSEEAEYNVLQAGGSQGLDIGYLPTVDAPVPPPGASVGQNPVTGYRLQALYEWGLNYMPYNFAPQDPQQAVFHQLYFRQALQLLMNQAAIVEGPLHGYGKISVGPVGDFPVTSYLSPKGQQGDPFPYNPIEARSLLKEHSWQVNSSGTSICVGPGAGPSECGRGVHVDTQLTINVLYATGNAWVESSLLELKSNASQVGINVTLTPATFDGVLNEVFGGCGTPAVFKSCKWQIADWGQGWSYVPDYLPTGDELFGSKSVGNIGRYHNHTNDVLIAKTLSTPNVKALLKAMWTWQNYLAQQLPVVMQPLAPAALVESRDDLRIGTLSPTLTIMPEDWYYVR